MKHYIIIGTSGKLGRCTVRQRLDRAYEVSRRISTALVFLALSASPARAQEPEAARENPPGAPPAQTVNTGELLDSFAQAVGRQRLAESTVGVVGSGALVGLGFAAEGSNMTASHWLWATGAAAGVGSIANFFVLSDLERLQRRSPTLSDQQLRLEWRKIADRAETERKVGAVVGSVLGIGGITVGSLVLAGQLGSFDASRDQDLVGATLMGAGGVTFGQGVVSWFVPSPAERGYHLLESPPGPSVSFSAAPVPGGAAATLQGVF